MQLRSGRVYGSGRVGSSSYINPKNVGYSLTVAAASYAANKAARYAQDYINDMLKYKPKQKKIRHTVKVKVPKSKLKTYTTGSLGRKTRKVKRVKYSMFPKKGSIIKVESGGTVSDTNCVYVGFGTCPMRQVNEAIGRAILKELFTQIGYDITRWDAIFEGGGYDMDCEIMYLRTPSSPSHSSQSVNLPFGQTFNSLAILVSQGIENAYIAWEEAILDKIRLIDRSSGGTVNRVIATVHTSNMMLQFQCSGILSLQNRTLAGDGSTEFTDIANNPVTGKIYVGKGNYFALRNHVNQAVNTPFFVPDLVPHFAVRSVDNQSVVTRKPVNPQDLLRVSKCTSVNIAPGQIRESKLYFEKKMNVTNFYLKYHDAIIATDQVHDFGKVLMFGLEKVVNDRTAEPAVNIGFEANITIKVASKYKRQTASTAIVREY